ncbi:helix-turn-helix domain-containing protein [Mammaliicoccus sciuri]|uniref:helix-turn-helix domain-containing protein n=1 Tax=Mammaliicoccus sciuri TaxID=1296 RepID=UPI0009921DCC|nr:helix-turn-helix transcriptional regulator [Mammaliicoccus sciuri]OOV39536.1 hypothetical protein BS756_00705 [Staphylococcus sp. MB371]RIN92372.1 XRE family transcriptional regulator [Mammaliicoccus sciuri]RIN97137.1 XRE family transcriptional regulator [Mammaliicoccus sciuri]
MNQEEAKEIHKYICYELASIRKQKGLQQLDVSYKLDITSGYLSRIENGKFQNTPLYLYLQICDEYNVTFSNVVDAAIKKYMIDRDYRS